MKRLYSHTHIKKSKEKKNFSVSTKRKKENPKKTGEVNKKEEESK